MSPLRKLTYFIKLVILDEIFIFFQNSVMPRHHRVLKKNENIAKRDFFDCVSFRSGLIYNVFYLHAFSIQIVNQLADTLINFTENNGIDTFNKSLSYNCN